MIFYHFTNLNIIIIISLQFPLIFNRFYVILFIAYDNALIWFTGFEHVQRRMRSASIEELLNELFTYNDTNYSHNMTFCDKFRIISDWCLKRLLDKIRLNFNSDILQQELQLQNLKYYWKYHHNQTRKSANVRNPVVACTCLWGEFFFRFVLKNHHVKMFKHFVFVF